MDPLIGIGKPIPAFALPDLQGLLRRPEEARGRLLLLNFWSAECPWAERVDRELLPLYSGWGDEVLWWSLASNANESLDLIDGAARSRGLPVVLMDAGHQVADLFEAQITPHFFVADRQGFLRYRGAFDDVTFRNRTATRRFLVEAITALLAGWQLDPAEMPPYGCAIVRF